MTYFKTKVAGISDDFETKLCFETNHLVFFCSWRFPRQAWNQTIFSHHIDLMIKNLKVSQTTNYLYDKDFQCYPSTSEMMIGWIFDQSRSIKSNLNWAVVVVQLAKRSLPTPEICGSNPDFGNISNIFICQLLSRKGENREKEAGNGPLKKNLISTEQWLAKPESAQISDSYPVIDTDL